MLKMNKRKRKKMKKHKFTQKEGGKTEEKGLDEEYEKKDG